MQGLKERQDAPQVLHNSGEPLNPISESYKPLPHGGCGCNRKGCLSVHNVFVLHKDGTPLTPTKPARAKKMMRDGVAKPVWNKFGQFGIQMLVDTRKETPKIAIGIDNGTKFEGYSVVCGNENNINVMWKLPDKKKKIVRKIKERQKLRRTRRYRNCRRRPSRFDNRNRKGFIAPSQLVIINSRLKAIKEILKTYPINIIGIEDVRFKNKKKGNNLSTIEVGKSKIYEFLSKHAILHKFQGHQTQKLRKLYGYHKVRDKAKEDFRSHCSDSLAMATSLTTNRHIHAGKLIIIDDSYRPVRRRLHDTQFSKGHIRYPYSQGNFSGIRKGTICELGTMCGGTKKYAWLHNWYHYRIGKSLSKIEWLSKRFFIGERVKGFDSSRSNNI
jgi:hypothetical protein